MNPPAAPLGREYPQRLRVLPRPSIRQTTAGELAPEELLSFHKTVRLRLRLKLNACSVPKKSAWVVWIDPGQRANSAPRLLCADVGTGRTVLSPRPFPR